MTTLDILFLSTQDRKRFCHSREIQPNLFPCTDPLEEGEILGGCPPQWDSATSPTQHHTCIHVYTAVLRSDSWVGQRTYISFEIKIFENLKISSSSNFNCSMFQVWYICWSKSPQHLDLDMQLLLWKILHFPYIWTWIIMNNCFTWKGQ